MIFHSMQERGKKGVHLMIKFIIKTFAIIGVIVLSVLLVMAKIAEKVSGMMFAIIFAPFVVMTLLAIFTSDWFALGVFASIFGAVLISFILVAILEFSLIDGRDYLRNLIR